MNSKNEWSRDEILEAMIENMYSELTYFAKHLKTVELSIEKDVTVVRSEVSDDSLNSVVSARFSEATAQKRVKEIISQFQKNNLSFLWWTSVLDTPQNLAEILEQQGLVLKKVHFGMYYELSNFSHAKEEVNLEIKKVQTQNELKDFAKILQSIGRSDKAYEYFYSKIPPHLYQDSKIYEMHVGYIEDRAVVTGALLLHANCAGIYSVATDPNYQRQGFATKMTNHLMQRAKNRGYEIVTLQASPVGHALYEHIGFKNLCEFKEYTANF